MPAYPTLDSDILEVLSSGPKSTTEVHEAIRYDIPYTRVAAHLESLSRFGMVHISGWSQGSIALCRVWTAGPGVNAVKPEIGRKAELHRCERLREITAQGPMTMEAISSELGVPIDTVQKWARRGQLVLAETDGRRYLWEAAR